MSIEGISSLRGIIEYSNKCSQNGTYRNTNGFIILL